MAALSHNQDQADELAALEAIYGDAFAPAGASFSIALAPSVGGDGERVWVSCALRVSYTREYPDEPAELALESLVGCSDAQAAELRGLMVAAALESAGAPYVFAVAERLREWLTDHNEKPSDGSAFDDMMRRARAKDAPAAVSAFSREDDPSIARRVLVSAAEEDSVAKRKRDGTPVTPASFAAWRAAFEAEMLERARMEDEALCGRARALSTQQSRARN